MAYVPPHKRHLKGNGRPLPTPEMLAPQFKRHLNLGFSRPNDRSGKIVYADNAKCRWFAVGLNGDEQFPPSVHLQPVSVESFESKLGQKPLALVNSSSVDADGIVGGQNLEKPWVYIAGKVMQDLLSSFECVRSEMEDRNLEDIKPNLVARLGRVLFLGKSASPRENQSTALANETSLRQVKRIFYTNVPESYTENIVDNVVPKVGAKFEEMKDVYHVKLSDKSRPDATVSCKCTVKKDEKGLQLYKIELNQIRHMVCDISCLDKNVDLRLMLCSKRILTTLSDNEKESITDLISSAILDPTAKGGLRWPFRKASSGDRYKVVGVWHTVSKVYVNSSMRLKVRDADRFDFRTSTGEVTREITLKLKGIASELLGNKLETSAISSMLEDTIKLLWENFLQPAHFIM